LELGFLGIQVIIYGTSTFLIQAIIFSLRIYLLRFAFRQKSSTLQP